MGVFCELLASCWSSRCFKQGLLYYQPKQFILFKVEILQFYHTSSGISITFQSLRWPNYLAKFLHFTNLDFHEIARGFPLLSYNLTRITVQGSLFLSFQATLAACELFSCAQKKSLQPSMPPTIWMFPMPTIHP